MKNKEVLILFKTHLDVGFTDYSENIIEKYLNVYIPNAIKVGYELKDTSTPFIWTVGSWLINEALKKDADGSVEKAVRDGILSWHALPFTTHTELMNTELFEYALDISEGLDARFGKKTIGAKMTDVPGHTIGMVPLMGRRGIKFLHIGVNPATPLPPLPTTFRWKKDDHEIIVMYEEDYGLDAEFDDFIVCFAHTGDNIGAQSAEEIVKIYDKIGQKYPGCLLRAATLDDVAEKMLTIKNLPVVDKEIGDTWIHGAGTDPQKVSRFRNVLRHIEKNGISVDLDGNLLLVPEHTWGLDVKTFFHNDTDYYWQDMEKLSEERSTIEKSWSEQRGYVSAAERLLRLTPEYPISEPNLSEYTEVDSASDLDIEVSWQIFDQTDYDRYRTDYMRTFVEWSYWDFTKPGLPDYKGGIYTAKVVKAYTAGSKMLYRLEFDKKIADEYGLPYFYLIRENNRAELRWFGKKISRLPQSCWVKVKGHRESWEINKLGTWIKPEDVVGSPLICACDKGVRNGKVRIYPLDSPLVAPFGRRLLQYGVKEPEQDLYFCLYNNIWNTNFPMWYSDDGMSRFEIEEY